MRIHEVEYLLGLSKKSIRYYEDEGLIHPSRSENNSYRIYSDEDINKLKRIKFLRELNVSIKDLKDLENDKLTLKDCLDNRISKIEMEEENYKQIKDMCMSIINNNDSYHDIDINSYLEKINVLTKKGFNMKEKSEKRKKITGAILSSVIFMLFFIFFIVVISMLQFTETDKMPWGLYLFVIGMFLIPLIGIVINLIGRIKEIKNGEEEEASIY